MTIEKNFDISFVAGLALREKQIQQNYRPIIAVHKWFARRPGTMFRALILAEFGKAPLADIFFSSNDFSGRKIADPFMGGGTPLIEANRVGCDVAGIDINPMSAWIVREEIEHLDVDAYEAEAASLIDELRKEIETFYLTDCPIYGDADVFVKYFLWVKVIDCGSCGSPVDLFPGYLLAEDSRHPKNVLVCPGCGELNEVTDRQDPGVCSACKTMLTLGGPAGRGRCACRHCGHINRYPRSGEGPPRHRVFAIEYHNPRRKSVHIGRFFKKPDAKDLARIAAAERRLRGLAPGFLPDQEVLPGDETNRLHRWGYTHYWQMFNDRQLVGLELSCRLVASVRDERIRHALATNLSDLVRYQNLLCRYDTWALKSLDIFSVHGFPVGLVACESNFLGISNGGVNVGSGGWANIIDKYAKAKRYCNAPFEIRRNGNHNQQVPILGEWIGEKFDGVPHRSVEIRCSDARGADFEPGSLDAVMTDPPYFGNVQYGELMDFCYVWLRRLVCGEAQGFERTSTRTPDELTGNVTKGRGIGNFTEGLAAVFCRMAEALRPGAPLVFTFHHNSVEAYQAVAVAILDAGLTCSASIPCPAEMGGSIHIHGTASSIVDTIFVCRTSGKISRRWLFERGDDLAEIAARDLKQLAQGGLKPTLGDIRCITLGHLTRMAVWKLRARWEDGKTSQDKLKDVAEIMNALADTEEVVKRVKAITPAYPSAPRRVSTDRAKKSTRHAVSF